MAANLRVWLPHLVRITLFNNHPDQYSPTEMLARFGVQEEMSQTIAAPKQKVAVGSFGAGKLQAGVTFDRIEIVWQVPVKDDQVWLGELPDVYRTLLEPLKELIRGDTWSRVALGVQAATPAEDHNDGYAALAEKLPRLQLDGANSSDFTYQINRFVSLVIGDKALRINRLMKWQVGKYMLAEIALAGGKSDFQVNTQRALFIGNVELDINNAPLPDNPLTGEQVIQILDFAAQQAAMLIERGDA